MSTQERETAARGFAAASGIRWDVVVVSVLGHVTALIKGDDSRLLPPQSSFEERVAFWSAVLARLTTEEARCADIGCKSARVNSATLNAGEVTLFWQLNHTTKETLKQTRPSIRFSAPSMSDEALLKASGLELSATLKAPFERRSCPHCNAETTVVETTVTGARWQHGHMIVMGQAGTLVARNFATPIITMKATPSPSGAPQPWEHALFQDTRFAHHRIDSVTGEDLTALQCEANSGYPALACAIDLASLGALKLLLSESTTWAPE